MPTYHYACEKCDNEFEIDQRISDPPRKRCPRCRGKVYRVIQPVAHILKGPGFYRTDYRDDDYSKKELAEKKSGEIDGTSGKTESSQAPNPAGT
jgi:putative FmdB family regulatory protein